MVAVGKGGTDQAGRGGGVACRGRRREVGGVVVPLGLRPWRTVPHRSKSSSTFSVTGWDWQART